MRLSAPKLLIRIGLVVFMLQSITLGNPPGGGNT